MGLVRVLAVLSLCSCASSASLRRRTQAGETLELINPVAAAPAAAAAKPLAAVVENGETLALIDEDRPVMAPPAVDLGGGHIVDGARVLAPLQRLDGLGACFCHQRAHHCAVLPSPKTARQMKHGSYGRTSDCIIAL